MKYTYKSNFEGKITLNPNHIGDLKEVEAGKKITLSEAEVMDYSKALSAQLEAGHLSLVPATKGKKKGEEESDAPSDVEGASSLAGNSEGSESPEKTEEEKEADKKSLAKAKKKLEGLQEEYKSADAERKKAIKGEVAELKKEIKALK